MYNVGDRTEPVRLTMFCLLPKLKIFRMQIMNISIDLLREKSNSIIYVTGVGVMLGQGLFRYPEMSKP